MVMIGCSFGARYQLRINHKPKNETKIQLQNLRNDWNKGRYLDKYPSNLQVMGKKHDKEQMQYEHNRRGKSHDFILLQLRIVSLHWRSCRISYYIQVSLEGYRFLVKLVKMVDWLYNDFNSLIQWLID